MFRVTRSLQVLLAVCFVACADRSYEIKQNAVLRTKNKVYFEGNFNCTFEHFLELPFHVIDTSYRFYSAIFPPKDDSEVKWQFAIFPRSPSNGVEYVYVNIDLKKLPKNASSLTGTFECGIIDFKGNTQNVKSQEATKGSPIFGFAFYLRPFISRDTLKSRRNELLPNGHLTLQCSVKGFINYTDISLNDMLFREVQVVEHEMHTLECGKKLLSDAMEHLSLNEYYLKPDLVLESSGKQFKRHKDIVSAQSTVLTNLFDNVTKSSNYTVTVFNFTSEMNAMELEDMLTFLYKGTAPYLDQTCRTLYVVAKKFQLDCLVATCEEVFISKLNQENAWEFLLFAKKHYAARLKKISATYISKYSEECL